ncbi:MAG: 4'-phosphopantetheinyl transferase superfamily protein [Oscillospiraceae bacterium]|nr:4'-phosphopantetheinyl transferase superfamily protein [Oscillospiraceae bacterium]
MIERISGYDPRNGALIFRVYTEEIPDTERRLRNRLSHLTASDLLGAAMLRDFGIRHVRIHRIGLGKPQLLHENLHMNLTHCTGLAAAAAGTVPLGIDAEVPRTVKEKLLPRLCTQEETVLIQCAEDKNLMFSRLWTLKESYAKFTGEGIGLDFSKLGFTPGNSPVFHHPASGEVQFYQIILNNHHVVSLCVPRGDYEIVTAVTEKNRKEDDYAVD